MHRFTPVGQVEARSDAANLGGAALVPPNLLRDDYLHWVEVLANTDRQTLERNKNIAAFLVAEAAETFRVGRIASAVAKVATHQVRDPDFQTGVRYLNARYAFSRLVGSLYAGNKEYGDASVAFGGNKDSKVLLDYSHNLQNAAYALIVSTDRLAREPFEGEPEGLQSDGQWYRNEELGLYVCAKSPARPSAALVDTLTLSTGSPEKAEEIIDAEHSVGLQPYVSLAYIAAAQ